MIEKYKSQLLEQRTDYFTLETQFKHINNQLKSTEAQVLVQEELLEHDKYVSARKVLSMQNQVNYLLTKDIQKATKSSKRRHSTIVSGENITIEVVTKKKGHQSKKSLLK
jgi:hypothetical protein